MEPMIDRIGGEAAVRALVARFYDLIETRPEAAAILKLHQQGHGLDHARAAQFDFLSGFFGGRRYYVEARGAMNLREIHAHLPIRPQEAEAWLEAMAEAMADTRIAAPMREEIMATFRRAARMLVNRDG